MRKHEDEERYPFIAVVGTSFAGKTTLVEGLSAYAYSRVRTVAEITQYAAKEGGFRQAPFATEEEAKLNIGDIIRWETERIRDAKRVYEQYGKPVILDRSIFGAVLLQKLLRDRYPRFHNAYEYAITSITDALESGKILIPKRAICIELDDVAAFRVRKTRETAVEFYREESNWRWFNEQYALIMGRVFPDSLGITIKSIQGGEREKLNIVEQALNFIES